MALNSGDTAWMLVSTGLVMIMVTALAEQLRIQVNTIKTALIVKQYTFTRRSLMTFSSSC
jgi:ammonia channel protein AmtB